MKIGDKLPKIVLRDHKGEEVDVSLLAGEKGLVLFLYPKVSEAGVWVPSADEVICLWLRPSCQPSLSCHLPSSTGPLPQYALCPSMLSRSLQADTPGCTTQACGYRDHHTEISELGYDIYGLSKDKPEAQQKVRHPLLPISPLSSYLG